MTLTEFLLTRIAEDEAVAREVRPDEHLQTRDSSTIEHGSEMGYSHVLVTSGRVLAECETKRRIVNESEPDTDGGYVDGWRDEHARVLYLLAAVYADHTDYREEWKP